MMIRPVRVPANPLTAPTNAFQRKITRPLPELLVQVRAEFDALAAALAGAGVTVVVFDDTEEPETPDAVFPNNWIKTHTDGRVAIFPMLAENRRLERRHDLIERLDTEHGFFVREIVDFSPHERAGRALEGTGSMILDRVNRIAYACVSPRTDALVLDEFCQVFDYRPFVFVALGRSGQPIYHTNVMMMLGARFAVVCLESIVDDRRREALVASLTATGHEIVAISHTQMECFAGNMLELAVDGHKVLAMSQRAFDSLTDAQRSTLGGYAQLLPSPVNAIEDCSGGSVRCMLAEIHLPRKAVA